MRKFWVWACLGVMASIGFADEPRIDAFDASGTLTIGEITNAAAYQVEWANQLDGTWIKSGRPDLRFIAPGEGNATVTATVPVRYRVVADVHSDYLVVDLSGGPSATHYPVSTLSEPPPGGWTDEHKTTKMVFHLIPAGTYERGSPTNEVGRFSTERLHPVTISKPFYIGVFEVTQQQWERVMGTWPSYFSNTTYRAMRPVEQVSHAQVVGAQDGLWWPATSAVDSDSFMGRLRERTGLIFHLPTDGEWEYAGRAGSTTALTSGLTVTNSATDANLGAIARYEGNSDIGNANRNSDLSQGTTTVGSYPPNAWGLYDIQGNVKELMADWNGSYPAVGVPLTDPRGPPFAPATDVLAIKVSRGGSAFHNVSNSRLAYRSFTFFSSGSASEGFRAVVRIYPDPLP